MPSFFQNLFKTNADDPAGESAEETGELATTDRTMNMPSPFTMSAGEHFTVRELSILLPAAFLRTEGLPEDQIVPLPLEILRASMQQGRPALRLSQVYQACPFLFVRQVQPGEDVEVALPFQKVKRLLESAGEAPGAGQPSPFTAVMPPATGAPGGTRGASPFAPAGASPFAAAPSASPFGAAPMASPFAVRTEAPADSPRHIPAIAEVEVLPANGVTPAAEPANPFAAAPPASGSPFNVAPSVPNPAPTPLPVVTPQPMPSPVFAPTPLGKASGNGNGNGSGHSPFPPPPAPAPVATLPPLEAAPSAPEPVSAAAPAANNNGIRVSLAALLRGVTAEELGFDPAAVPGTVEVEISPDTIMPQLPTGRVEISVEELRQGVIERFRPAFARVRSDLRFVVPLTEIFRKLPAEALPVAAPPVEQVVTTPPFQTPFALRAEEEKERGPLPITPMPLPPAPAAGSTLSPFPPSPPPSAFTAPVPASPAAAQAESAAPVSLPAAPEPVAEEAPAPATPPASTPKLPSMPAAVSLPKLPNIPGMSGRPSPFSRPPAPSAPEPAVPAPIAPQPSMPPADAHADLGNSFSAGSLRAEPPAPSPAFDPASVFGSAPTPQPPAPAPVAAAPAPAAAAPAVTARPSAPAVSEDFSFGAAEDLVQLALRALFLTSDPLTPASIADKCAAFPGLRACLVVQADGTRHSGSSQTGSDVAHFHDSAHRSAESLRMLAESLGQEPRGTFTLRSGGGVRTVFLERTVSLAVLHDGTDFQPGVREKLALTVRALADMRA